MAAGVKLALEFLDGIKGVYGKDSPGYQKFIDVIKDFKIGSADTREATKRVIVLFQGHPELIEGYAAFLPPGNTIQIPEDPQGNIIVTMTTGTMEIARDGTVVNETYIQMPEPQSTDTKLPELAERDKRLLENLRVRIADSGEHKEKYEVFMASFEVYLKMPPEERKVSLASADQGHEFMEELKELLGDDEFKNVSSEVFG